MARVPTDPDVDDLSGPAGRPVHLRKRYVTLVFLGGALGTLARFVLESWLPMPAGWPLPTLLINISGAFLLGVLLESLLRAGQDTGWLRLTRLGVGTGFMGGFTTYSTFALEAVQLGPSDDFLAAAGYVVATLVGGVLASTLGIWLAAGVHRRHTSKHDHEGTRP